MRLSGPWEHFVDQICQLEYEWRLIAHRLSLLEKRSKYMQIALAIFAPTSAATGLLSWLDPFPQLKIVFNIVWQFAIWATVVVAVPFAAYLSPRIESLRSVKGELDKHVGAFRAILNEAHFRPADSPEWVRMAREATAAYSGFVFHKRFSDSERRAAWNEVLEMYDAYLGKGEKAYG